MHRLSILLLTVVFSTTLMGCGDSDQQSNTDAHSHNGSEAHEHGEETHTHDMPADTAGTYRDTTGAFFDTADSASAGAGDAEAPDAGHEHGPDTHVH